MVSLRLLLCGWVLLRWLCGWVLLWWLCGWVVVWVGVVVLVMVVFWLACFVF